MANVKSIKCTNCAAPLDLLGGGRVETITCSYCKSTLDLNDNYKVLTNFKQAKVRQDLPFKIGMKGELKGIEYTIIGLVTYQSIEYPLSEWTDFLLFSPFYGYAYLTYEEGHLIYSKRNRTFPNTPWHKIPRHGYIMVDGRNYEPFDTYGMRVKYVEGELTWVAKQDDKSSVTDLISPPYGISIEKTKHELEHYESEYLDSESVYKTFNIEKEPKPKSFHILKPFKQPFLKSLSHISFWVLFVIALFAAVVLFDGQGRLIQNFVAHNTQPINVNFHVQDTKYLVDLELSASNAKALDNFQLEIYKDKKIYFSLSPKSAYIFNQKTGVIEKKLHPWDKKSTKVRVSLNIKEGGSYTLHVRPINKILKSDVSIQIKEASSRVNYFVYLFLLTLLFWLIYKYMEWRYHRNIENERGIGSNISPLKSLNLTPVMLIGIPMVLLVIIKPEFLIPVIFISIFVLTSLRTND
jgi:hypothetical protein